MFARVTVLLLVFFAQSFAAAQNANKDILVMKNGDRFSGEIKGLTDGVLSVKLDYVQGLISIQWSQVVSVHSDHLFLIKTQEGRVYTGKLNDAVNDIATIEIVKGPGNVVDISQSRIISITPTSENFWRRLDGAVNTGLLYSKGNESLQYSVTSQVAYNTARTRSQVGFGSTLSSNSGSDLSTRNFVNMNSFRLMRSDNWFYGGSASFLQSSVQQIHAETTLGAGVGRYLTNTNRASIYVLGGVGWQHTAYTGVPIGQGVPDTAVGFVATNIKVFKFKKTNLNVSATVLPAISDLGRVHLNTSAVYFIKIIGDLSFNVSAYGNFDNRPPPSVPGSDYGSSSGLSWTFGNNR